MQDFCSTFGSNEKLCSNIFDAKQAYLFKHFGCKATILTKKNMDAKEDFCSNVRGAKQNIFETFGVQFKTFVQTFWV